MLTPEYYFKLNYSSEEIFHLQIPDLNITLDVLCIHSKKFTLTVLMKLDY